MTALLGWGVRLSSILTGYAISDILGWFDSGDKQVGGSMMWLLTGLFTVIIGLLGYIIFKHRK